MRILIKALVLMTVFFVLSSQKSFAQFIEIGNGDTHGTYPSFYGPWGNYWENCRTQTLYLSSELGAPTGKCFTSLAWNFQQISSEINFLNNVAIRIKETTDSSLNAGAYADMAGATQVFYAATLVPATSTGWNTFDIIDYSWNGTNNLIIEVSWGDNGYHTCPFYQTYKTDAVSVTRMLIGYADEVTPPEYSGASSFYDNMRWYWSPLPGNIQGFVFNYDGLIISGATLTLQNGLSTTSNANGYYFFSGVNSGNQAVSCVRPGYNPASVTVEVIASDTVAQNFNLTQPNMVIIPLYIDETLNPGEFFTTSLGILNNGNGNLSWQATINYIPMPGLEQDYSFASSAASDTSNWLTMDHYNDTVPPFGGVSNVPVHLDASGAYSGDVYSAEVVFTSNPSVGTITVPVTMTILGPELIAPENLGVSLVDDVAGKVKLIWDWNGDAFQFFSIKRDGVIIGATTSQTYTEFLPDYGNYCFTVQAVYDEGSTRPAGPSCVEWPNPVLYVDPDSLEARVWTGFTEDVYTTVANQGVGTLNYSFPEFAALDLLNNPDIEKNKPGAPTGVRSEIQKSDESGNGKGYPVILGAGGPDSFGYVWIDSDEPGGPNFSYTDISTTGSPIYGLSDDNSVGPYNIGFEFPYYGEHKTRFWINSNGVIGFTPNYITLGNTGIPTNSSTYIDFIAWFWDDMYFRTGTSQAFYQAFSDKTIIQFKNYERFDEPGYYVDAEVILYMNGRIAIMYDNIDAGITLNSCTVGIQSSMPDQGLQVAYNTIYLHNDLSILFSLPADFIVDVEPAFGSVVQGGSEQVTITYDSEDYEPGDYTQDLLLESDDPENPIFVITNTMHVYSPALIAGTVKDHDDDIPLPAVLVKAGPFQTTTGEDGEYSLFVDEGNYIVVFEKPGYMIVTVEDTIALQGVITPISIDMWDMNYPPGLVHAGVMEDSSWCEVTWTLPQSATIPGLPPGIELNDLTYKGILGMSMRDVTNYRIGRFSDFDPDGSPAAGNLAELANTGNLYYNDYEWNGLPQGWYAYGVKAMYTSGLYSSYTISNIVGHLMDCRVTVNVILSTGMGPDNVEVTLKGSEYPYETYVVSTPASGTALFDLVWKGHYDISAFKTGYDICTIENNSINDDKVFNLILSEKKYPPTNLKMDPVSLEASWDSPLRIALEEGFEDTQFPPPGWQSLTASPGYGWFRSHDASSAGLLIPPWDSYYAVVMNDTAGLSNNGCCTYLITPPLDLRESEGYALTFNSFYNGINGQPAFIEYSLDAGTTWNVLLQLMPDTNWAEIEVDLSVFSGMTGPSSVWIAFHSDDLDWGSVWAVDNVLIEVPSLPANYIDYWVFLDGAFDGVTEDTAWNYAPLWYGKTYTASVAAHYSSGLSVKSYYTFTCDYLFPPRNLTGSAPDDAAILVWDPPLELWPSLAKKGKRDLIDGTPENLLGYNIYRDDVMVDYLDHADGIEPQGYVDEGLEPGIYQYSVTGVYDLAPYGLTGETDESAEEGPAEVVVDYCYDLEFIETWSMGNFENNKWISEGANWLVNGLVGKPAPSVEFTWDPIQHEYAIPLESYPLCAVGITEGDIWLDFDLALNILQPTGEETLLAQVWNWQSKIWTTVAVFSNADGNFDWTAEHVGIGTQARDKVFKIRFLATGVYSLNIINWFVDNIHVYRTCAGPSELTAEPAFGEGILLSWQLSKNIELRDLTGFSVYQGVNGGSYELLSGLVTGNQYIIPEDGLIPGSVYCYKVSAIWASETDQCESDFSNEACAFWTAVDNNTDPGLSSFSLYPNPADSRAFITSTSNLEHIMIIDATGQLIFDQSHTGRQFEFNTSCLSIGVYLVRIETSSGIATRKLTIQR